MGRCLAVDIVCSIAKKVLRKQVLLRKQVKLLSASDVQHRITPCSACFHLFTREPGKRSTATNPGLFSASKRLCSCFFSIGTMHFRFQLFHLLKVATELLLEFYDKHVFLSDPLLTKLQCNCGKSTSTASIKCARFTGRESWNRTQISVEVEINIVASSAAKITKH